MSDRELSRRERAWRSGGAPEGEVGLLLARLRAGRVRERGLALAAYLGHEPAALALAARGRPAPPGPGEGVDRLAAGLHRFGAAVCARAALAVARRVSEVFPRPPCDPRFALPVGPGERERARRAAEGWLLCPCARCRGEVARALATVEAAAVPRWERHERRSPREPPPEGPPELIACRIVVRSEPLARKGLDAELAVREAAHALDDEDVVEAALREALIPWALGEQDPLRAGEPFSALGSRH